MNNNHSIFGSHCPTCGSLVEVCGDLLTCKLDAQLHIDNAIRSGNPSTSYGSSSATDVAYLTEVAHMMLGETIMSFRKS